MLFHVRSLLTILEEEAQSHKDVQRRNLPIERPCLPNRARPRAQVASAVRAVGHRPSRGACETICPSEATAAAARWTLRDGPSIHRVADRVGREVGCHRTTEAAWEDALQEEQHGVRREERTAGAETQQSKVQRVRIAPCAKKHSSKSTDTTRHSESTDTGPFESCAAPPPSLQSIPSQGRWQGTGSPQEEAGRPQTRDATGSCGQSCKTPRQSWDREVSRPWSDASRSSWDRHRPRPCGRRASCPAQTREETRTHRLSCSNC